MKELLTEDEWERLKGAYEDFASDVGRSLDALLLRTLSLAQRAAELAPGAVRELREALEALSFATIDIDDRFAAFERKLSDFRPRRESQ